MKQMDKKKKNYLILVVIGLVIILLGIAFMIYRNIKNNSSYTDPLGNPDSVYRDYMYQSITVEEAKDIVETELSLLDGKKNLNEITNQQKLTLALNLYLNSEEVMDKQNNGETLTEFPASDLDKYFEKTSIYHLGKLTHENIMMATVYSQKEGETLGIEWQYDANNNKYILNTDLDGNGVGNSTKVATKMCEFKEDSGRYYLSQKYLWSAFQGNEADSINDVYGTYDDGEKMINKVACIDDYNKKYGFDRAPQTYLDENYEAIKDRLETYTYVFQKLDNKIDLVDFYVN